MKRFLLLAALLGPCLTTPLAAQGYKPVAGPHTLNPGDWPAHYPFADETEAAVAAPEVHHVRYIDAHVRLVEVAYFPGVVGNMHGHPYPSVFAVDAPVPHASNTPLDPTHNMVAVVAPAPQGATYPFCRAASPQNPHHESNLDSFPHHFYRLEFLSPDTAGGHGGLIYEDDHIRLVEVLIRPGETKRLPASPYPFVIASDAGPVPAPADGHASPPLAGFPDMGCTTGSKAPATTLHNTTARPVHYYRFDYKRIDGDRLKDHWRQWYPWLARLKDAYDASPNQPNF